MIKRMVLATVAVFIAWSILDYMIHGMLLQSIYEVTAHLWRPMADMKMSLMHVVTLIFAVAFVAIYGFLVREKSLFSGIVYGGLFGIATGTSMGFGSYAYMPISLTLAWSWFLGSLFKTLVAGAIVGAIVRR